jgi:hypothetical protein
MRDDLTPQEARGRLKVSMPGPSLGRLETAWTSPKPIVTKLPPVKAFVREMLPARLSDYVMDVAERQQAPADFAAVTCICGLGAALGNRVRICPKQHDDWEVVANPWGAIIGRPSAMKSPAMKAALAPLFALERQMREAWQTGIDAKAAEEALDKLMNKGIRRQAEKALSGGNRATAERLLGQLTQADEDRPPCPRLIVNDATVAKLGELLNQNSRGLLQMRDELHGFLAHIEDEQFRSERAFYLECYNGHGQYTFDRIERGSVHIENCSLGMIGGIQPSRIASLVRSAVDGSNNDGLVQRLQLAVWPDDPGSWRWVDRAPELNAKLAYEETFIHLHKLGEDGLILHFADEAQGRYQEFEEQLHAKARSDNVSSVVESHLLKMPKTIASLALIFEVVNGGTTAVGEVAIKQALRWGEYLLGHAERLYAAADVMAENGAKLIIARRAQLPSPFTVRDVQRKGWAGLAEYAAVQAAIEMLITAHYCRALRIPSGPSGGRPSEEFQWNSHLSH